MADVKDEIERQAKRDEAAIRKAAEALAAAEDAVDEETRELAKQTYDRIKAARAAGDKN